jgi:7-cyano-7-deazaguanine synthase in queuosine biosynthesis
MTPTTMLECNNRMSVNILFSGGYDSTLLLCKAVNLYHDINLITVDPSFIIGKAARERQARDNIIDVIRAASDDCDIRVSNITIDISDSYYTDSSYLVQPLFWLPSIFVMTKRDKDAVVQIGYICGDQALTHINEFNKMADAVSKFKDKELHVVFPLAYSSKEAVLEELFTHHREVIDLCTTCESDEEADYCGECTTCKNIIKTLKSIAADDHYDMEFRKWAVDKLKLYDIDASILLSLHFRIKSEA